MVRKLEELNLIDNFLFEALAGHPEIGAAFGRKLVEIILHRSPEKDNKTTQGSVKRAIIKIRVYPRYHPYL